MDIPFTDFGGTGELLHFAHANGYPPACYHPLVSRLVRRYRVIAMHQRPLWKDSRPQDLDDWRPLADDLLRFLDQQQTGPVIGVGHSMGGIATFRAALREPDRFKAVILLDPVLFPPYFIRAWNLVKRLKLEYRIHPLIQAAQRRRDSFDNLDALYRGYRRKAVFKYLDDDALRAYIDGISCPDGNGGYQLCYPAAWEARIYATGIWKDMELWRGLRDFRVPLAYVRGAESDTFWEKTARLVNRMRPDIRLDTLAGSTHLVPLEKPSEVFSFIHSFLDSIPATTGRNPVETDDRP